MKNCMLIGLITLVGCQQTAQQPAQKEQTDKVITKPEVPVGKTSEQPPEQEQFPPISVYTGREYSEKLQKELDARNTKRPRTTETMTLVNASLGEDGGQITFRDAKGKLRYFDGWPYELLQYHEVEFGEDVNDNFKGERFEVTHTIEAYWSDPGGEVVENPVVEKMKQID